MIFDGEDSKATFEGIDDWGRPVFSIIDRMGRKLYEGSVDDVFPHSASEEEVLERVSEENLVIFGGRFGCEPLGYPIKYVILPGAQ